MKKNKEYLLHFDHIIVFKQKPDNEVWNRILDAFMGAVDKEGAYAGGGIHELGSVHTCCEEGINVCQECLKVMKND